MLGPPIRSAYPMVVLGTDLPVSAWQRLSVATYKSATDCGDEITTRLVTLHRIPEPYWGEVPELDQMRHAGCVAADSIAPTSR
jgi:hypothetical protein